MEVKPVLCVLVAALWIGPAAAWAQSVVYNGSFERVGRDGAPDGWTAAGRAGCVQRLSAVDDPSRGRVAQLECTAFEPGYPDSHAMVAQVGRVAVRRGQHYLLSFWARARDLHGSAVRVALSNTRQWSNAGLMDSFVPGTEWERFEFRFRASQSVAAADSRLQIWYGRTGTLFLDDVEMVPAVAQRAERHPQITLDGVRNAVPNSSFECGGSGWGCWTPQYYSWGTSPFRLLGELDESRARHGGRSWKLTLRPDAPRMFFDYYDPVDAVLRAVAVGHEGWVVTEPGRAYTFSAWVSADRPGVPVAIYAQNADGPRRESKAEVGTEWQRLTLSFTAEREYVGGSVGVDLRDSGLDEATVWIDAVQFEPGGRATPYAPRSAVETRIVTDRAGNVFTDPEAGLTVSVEAFNAGDENATARGRMHVTDYRDRTIWEGQAELKLGAGQHARLSRKGIPAGRRGFFRVHWQPEGGLEQNLRCAVIEPSAGPDASFGMNHAFGWRFLLELSHAAGLRWWRDWSVKWQTVQPEPDGFDFSAPDAQIDRCLEAGGQVLVLLPFPSARWASSPDRKAMEEVAGARPWIMDRLPMSFKPDDIAGWRRYVRESVAHYWPRVRVFEILNEALYTHYSLPARAGYTVDDYMELLRAAYEEAKKVAPECRIVGGFGAGPERNYLEEFIQKGGMQWCDVLNYHRYPSKGWAENFEPGLRDRWEQLVRRGETRPIWMTEFGIYADDDPPVTPPSAGDATMNNAMRADELEGAADLVRYAAIMRAYGVTKVFYHAGTTRGFREPNAGNVFFEYGGAPRKQYAAIAALSRLMRADAEFVKKWTEPEWLTAYEFRAGDRSFTIAWTREGPRPLPVPDGYHALDLMGNPIGQGQVQLDAVPAYLVAK